MLQRIMVGVSLFLIAGLLVTLGFLGRVATETIDATPNLEDKTVLATAVSTQMSSITSTNPQDFLLLDEMREVLQEEFFDSNVTANLRLETGILSEIIALTGSNSFDLDRISKIINFVIGLDPEVTPEEVQNAAIQGLIRSLDDRNTSYLTPEDMKYSADNSDGNYEGIGASVDSDGEYVIIIAPFDGSPALAAGIQAGDKILKVDGIDAIGWTVQEGVDLIRGPAGTTVILTVQHPDGSVEDISIVRGEIPLLTVSRAPSGIAFKDRSGNLVTDLAYIRIARINPNTPQEVRDAVSAAEEKAVKGIIFDVRSNPGGLLTETVEITDMFLDKGIIYSALYRDGTNVVKEASNGVITNLPIIVLQDSYSASGAELFAAGLKENDRAIIMGETSYGKGSVNNAFPLSNGGALYTTIARWFTPDGNLIEKEGIDPDVEVSLTLEDFEAGIERYKVLWAGIDLLRKQIASE
jgi:carboxyl-terminal processing protease